MNAIMNKTNNGKRLIAAVAIFAMLACVFAVAMPFSGADAAAPTYADNAEIQRGDIVTENATVQKTRQCPSSTPMGLSGITSVETLYLSPTAASETPT